jgi:hypothetical protein
MTSRSILYTLLLAASALASNAQTWTAGRIEFKHPGTFSQTQLESVSGMRAGDKANADTMQAAAQKLVDTGYFDDVGVALGGTGANIAVIFTLAPIPTSRMLPLGFENFIWLTQPEIDAAIRTHMALYIPFLPEGSPQADLVDAALRDALAAKGIQAKVFHETVEPTLEHPARTLEFRITSPLIRVANVKLGGVSPDLVPLVQKSVNATARTPFNDGRNGRLTRDSILAPLLDAGYIQAELTNFTPAIQPVDSGIEPLIVSAALNPGEIYRVSTISFAGAPLLSAETFAAGARLHPGDIASRKLLLETLTPLDAAYRREGYMDVIVTAAPTLDTTTHQVAYKVTVEPGTPYHLHEITPRNLDPVQVAAFNRVFAAHPGDVFNPEYVVAFLKQNTAVHELIGCNAAYKAVAYPATHTVDLFLTFACHVQVKG